MLKVDNITKVFGGLSALSDVTFSIAGGSITGIIGPNGAGKTTLFNIITGLYSRTSGNVFFNDSMITGLPPEKLARIGLVRTFQNIELFEQMTVLENVMVGLHSRTRSGIISCVLKFPGQLKEERKTRETASYWLEYCGIGELSNTVAANLPFGKGRLLEIARAMALQPRIIFMDEPAAGLNGRETSHLADLIRRIKESGVTVVLVEHDMELIMDICDSIVVLDLGRKIAEGTPIQIQENQDVIAAYLGAD
jgi:ABC-type branched-subunit amino acid transport system ATPase component